MTRLLGRREELRRIRDRIDGPGPSLTLVSGPRRAGTSTFLRAAVEAAAGRNDVLWYRAAPLSDADHRALLARRMRRFVEERGPVEGPGVPGPDADWPDVFRALTRHLYATRRRSVVVLDGWHRIVEARSRIYRPFTEFWLAVRRRGVPLHLLLSSVPAAPLEPFRDPDDPLSGWLDEELRLGPLPYRDVTGLLPASRGPRERLLAYTVFGGWPDAARRLDPARDLRENVLEEILGPAAPLREWGAELLEREMQAPGRYASLLRALAGGARTWGELRRELPAFGSGGQLAPYLQRLDALGLVEVRRSLDASPDSRSRRYRIVDPLPAFWFRFVLPHLSELEIGRHEEVWTRRIRPRLDDHLSLLFPAICRTWLAEYADERLPARAREVGALWGSDYDLDVAGLLEDGSVVRGLARWSGDLRGDATLEAVEEQADRTRYGFGRRRRHSVMFTGREPRGTLPGRADDDGRLHVIGPADLLGADDTARPPGGAARG